MINLVQKTKIWYILIKENQEGPFSVEELKQDPRITLDTLALKQGWETWKPIRDIPELAKLFQKEAPSRKPQKGTWEIESKELPQDEIVLDFGSEPPYLLWALFVLVCLIYVIFKLYL